MIVLIELYDPPEAGLRPIPLVVSARRSGLQAPVPDPPFP